MMQSKLKTLKRLASKVKGVTNGGPLDKNDSLLPVRSDTVIYDQDDDADDDKRVKLDSPKAVSPGRFAVYVGEERLRFLVKKKYLTHPLLKMLLEKASNEFGHDHRDGLIVPCSVSAFQEVMNAVECSQGGFEFGELVDELL